MRLKTPRVTLHVEFEDETDTGEFSLISLGFGFHQAWVYSTMFAAPALFHTSTVFEGMFGNISSQIFLTSIIVFSICLVLAGFKNEFIAEHIRNKTLVVIGALCMSGGTLLLALPLLIGQTIPYIDVISGIITGIGSAILILNWGTHFALLDVSSIAINSVLSVGLGFFIYAGVITALPYPLGGICTACMPLIEVGVLLYLTQTDKVSQKHISFNPLPIGKNRFILKFSLPVFIFGLALGVMRQTSTQSILSFDTATNPSITLAAISVAILAFIAIVITSNKEFGFHGYFKRMMPLIACAILMIPFAAGGQNQLASIFMLAIYLCFETLMWTLFGEISQRYRLSPILVFGCGKGFLGLASTLGAIVSIFALENIMIMPFGESTIIFGMLVVMVFAYSLMPDARELYRMVDPKKRLAVLTMYDDEKLTLMDKTHATQSSTSKNSLNQNISASNSYTQDVYTQNIHEHHFHTEAEKMYTEALSETDFTQSALSDSPHVPVPTQEHIARSSIHTPKSSTSLTGEDHVQQPHHLKTNNKSVYKKGIFKQRCETVANTYLLSAREAEVMYYLAKGYNAAFIQEKLYISEGTAKTHMRHIYRKLNIHAQQELIRLVESTEVR